MLKWIKVNSLLVCVCVFSPAWVDAVWECEFTDAEPLDPAVEEEIKEDVNAFKKVYEQLLPFSTADVDDNTQVMPASERACSDPMCFLRSYRSYTCLSFFLSFPATERVEGVGRKRRVGEVSGGRAGVLRPRRQNQIVQRGAETPQSAGRIALPAAARRPG